MKQLFTIAAIMMGISFAQARQNPLAALQVADASGFLMNGTFEVKRFITKQGQVYAIGVMRGTLGGKQVTHGLQLPVTIGEVSTAAGANKHGNKATAITGTGARSVPCAALRLAFGSADITVLGLPLQMAPMTVNITAEELPADMLCPILELEGVGGPVLDVVVGMLNKLLGALGELA